MSKTSKTDQRKALKSATLSWLVNTISNKWDESFQTSIQRAEDRAFVYATLNRVKLSTFIDMAKIKRDDFWEKLVELNQPTIPTSLRSILLSSPTDVLIAYLCNLIDEEDVEDQDDYEDEEDFINSMLCWILRDTGYPVTTSLESLPEKGKRIIVSALNWAYDPILTSDDLQDTPSRFANTYTAKFEKKKSKFKKTAPFYAKPEKTHGEVEVEVNASYGWVAYNNGPSAWFWGETREALEHELSDDIRPATALEKLLMNRIGNNTHGITLEEIFTYAKETKIDITTTQYAEGISISMNVNLKSIKNEDTRRQAKALLLKVGKADCSIDFVMRKRNV